MNLLDEYLKTIDRRWVRIMKRRARELGAAGWKLESYDLEGRLRKCFFTRNGEVTQLVAPAMPLVQVVWFRFLWKDLS